MTQKCKRCLLYEAGEFNSFETVRDYISNLSEELKVSSEEYGKRLNACKKCDSLIAGMCLKCGCYVEVRAALRENSCPDFGNSKW